jgi:ADP-heptose:LPS heptosyltransferase
VAREFPDARLQLIAPAALAPLVELASPRYEVVDHAWLGPLPALAIPDVAVNLHGRGPESHELLKRLRPRRLVAFGSARAGVRGPLWRAGEHEVERWCRMLREAGIAAEPSDLDLPAPDVEPPAAAVRATVVHPGAASGARRWPVERFAAVTRASLEEGRAVVMTGSSEERGLAEDVAARAGLPASSVLAGRTDLMSLAATVAAAERVVCGDTGVAHLATAFGTPSVALFGPVPPCEWGPPAGSARHRALWAGRRGDPHAAAPDPGLLAISVGDVLEALASLAAARAPARA